MYKTLFLANLTLYLDVNNEQIYTRPISGNSYKKRVRKRKGTKKWKC